MQRLHYFCTTLVRRGVALAAVQQLAGHSNIAITNRYTHAHAHDLHDGIAVFGFPATLRNSRQE